MCINRAEPPGEVTIYFHFKQVLSYTTVGRQRPEHNAAFRNVYSWKERTFPSVMCVNHRPGFKAEFFLEKSRRFSFFYPHQSALMTAILFRVTQGRG